MHRFAIEKKKNLETTKISINLVNKYKHILKMVCNAASKRMKVIYMYRCTKMKFKTLFTKESKLQKSIISIFIEF